MSILQLLLLQSSNLRLCLILEYSFYKVFRSNVLLSQFIRNAVIFVHRGWLITSDEEKIHLTAGKRQLRVSWGDMTPCLN
jgi:hypothetical protein